MRGFLLFAALLALMATVGCGPKQIDPNDPNLNINASRMEPKLALAGEGAK